MHVLSRQRGVSLIEVLMAVLIFSIGLIGLAGLLVMATRSNQAGYLRTQVTFLASNMADRMRSNPVGLWNGNYNSTAYPTTAKQSCDINVACTAQQVAVRDQYLWSSMLTTSLPEATASIQCSDKSAAGFTPSADQIGMRPPYGGNCEMKISWSERRAGDKEQRDAKPQTFVWAFQP
ncbi:type IV pilus modification protein PilV [Dyella silvatica]|uniref:type IV pilus modification protein PilV n=1 Tax=Dyella silvatica TaxID=2992128 RepID=UPI002254B6D6|nr:type IV pilus modification protein PilV [Dyella silvatica]